LKNRNPLQYDTVMAFATAEINKSRDETTT